MEYQGKTISPRPELIQEMFSEAKVKFYMYTGDRFLKYAEEFLQLSKQPETIEEAEEIRLEEEKQNQISTIIYDIYNDINQTKRETFNIDSWVEDLNNREQLRKNLQDLGIIPYKNPQEIALKLSKQLKLLQNISPSILPISISEKIKGIGYNPKPVPTISDINSQSE
ncbi:hypothetical protein STA3757_46260 [Stanieria sp. NIES-3757]|nr:hypothetical protein STA3757_46260 [Stanieria sp. NIES-3757]